MDINWLDGGDMKIGSKVKINGSGDLMMDRSVGKYIGREGIILRLMKSGLYVVYFGDYCCAFAKRNIDLV